MLLLIAVLLVAGAVGASIVLADDEVATRGRPRRAGRRRRADGHHRPADHGDDAPPAPVSGFATPGLLTFRGSPTRTLLRRGPGAARAPRCSGATPARRAACAASPSTGERDARWCGTGWTGQPSVFERDGRTWVVFGAYDRGSTSSTAPPASDILPPFPTGDIIKGSVTVDPDGFPLVYSGSRDNYFRVLAIDRPEPTELWTPRRRRRVARRMWNDDWDGSPLIIDDYLFEGGENSQFHIVKLNRSYGPDGLVQVDPELVFNTPGWDQELLGAPSATTTCRSRTRSRSTTTSSTSPTPAAWCRAGTSSGLADGVDADPGVPVLDRRRHRRLDRRSTRRASSTSPPSTSGATPRRSEVGQLMKLDPPQAGRPARVVGRRPRPTRRLLGHAGAARRRPDRADRRRPGRRRRQGDRRGALGVPAARRRRGSRRSSSTTC